ncbi:acyltransferase [Ferruginibacter albus]|uniref:acyltransferase n=1 Tax=Ferruginibacter albus TaxID=2875540 RepID=UPI001CC76C77|nr:acyltransferase [Ferruginibacter albus]UAY50687.1 acyltransferase [Ferruginibacter albus]
MMTLIKSYLGIFKNIVRFFYWQFCWIKNAKTGRNGTVLLPFIMEGKGKLITGSNFYIGKAASLRLGQDAIFQTGNKLNLSSKSDIKVSKGCIFKIGNNFKIDSNSKLVVNNIWEWGNNVTVGAGCVISSREKSFYGKLTVGHDTVISDNSIIDVCDNINIGNEVSIGPNCILYTHDHIYTDKNVGAWKGGVRLGSISIGDGTWIASGVTILPGVNIGRRVVVAAGSVVTKNLESEAIYGGVPARLIKKIE